MKVDNHQLTQAEIILAEAALKEKRERCESIIKAKLSKLAVRNPYVLRVDEMDKAYVTCFPLSNGDWLLDWSGLKPQFLELNKFLNEVTI